MTKKAPKLLHQLSKRLDDCIIENFADLYVLENELKSIERKFDVSLPEVIAAIATCADVAAAQKRLTAQAPKALLQGLPLALSASLRPSARLMVEVLLGQATRQQNPPLAGPTVKMPCLMPKRLTEITRRAYGFPISSAHR